MAPVVTYILCMMALVLNSDLFCECADSRFVGHFVRGPSRVINCVILYIGNGFESLSDIKSLTEDELNEMPLNLGEKIRVRKLIDSLNMPPPSSPYSPSGNTVVQYLLLCR